MIVFCETLISWLIEWLIDWLMGWKEKKGEHNERFFFLDSLRAGDFVDWVLLLKLKISITIDGFPLLFENYLG